MTVTALSWNSKYSDLIEVGYGTYDIYNQGEGLILLFSLKNPSYPENIIETTCGVFCLQSSPTRPYIIAVGFFDGSIKVYDVRTKNNTPKYSSEISNKHIESIWKIQWLDEDSNGYMNFASIGAEGKVILWTLVKNELRPSVLLTISRNEYQKNSFDNLNYGEINATYLRHSNLLGI
ncbi:dynein intermediate chain 1, axonemal-like [Octopus sinensis]|uniref:Dynein intermediate chain 1, axonemal-like n=1 Tax=Octopus sinensis TaxID=2607531 RepID=A0A6P7TVN1_9MOLL|nr:dynein intermediate chain 1, axonemal-like [Octopus sinensis]XP_029656424.2 dynein intermediate chain 1, axonemal-like [Octopus sinensis]